MYCALLVIAEDKADDSFQIFVMNLLGKTVPINVAPMDTIMSLKVRLQEKVDVPFVQQRLTFQGKMLENDDTILSHGIAKSAKVELTLPMLGGGI